MFVLFQPVVARAVHSQQACQWMGTLPLGIWGIIYAFQFASVAEKQRRKIRTVMRLYGNTCLNTRWVLMPSRLPPSCYVSKLILTLSEVTINLDRSHVGCRTVSNDIFSGRRANEEGFRHIFVTRSGLLCVNRARVAGCNKARKINLCPPNPFQTILYDVLAQSNSHMT